jgi:hypothetical protein
MWIQFGPYRINLAFLERYLPVKDDEGTKIELRYASGQVQQVPVPEEEIDRVLADLDEVADPEIAESDVVVRWQEASEADAAE